MLDWSAKKYRNKVNGHKGATLVAKKTKQHDEPQRYN